MPRSCYFRSLANKIPAHYWIIIGSGESHNSLMWLLQLVMGNSSWIAISISWQHFQIIVQLPMLSNIFIANENRGKGFNVSIWEISDQDGKRDVITTLKAPYDLSLFTWTQSPRCDFSHRPFILITLFKLGQLFNYLSHVAFFVVKWDLFFLFVPKAKWQVLKLYLLNAWAMHW